MNRILLHSDLNNFYASVECLYNEQLRQVPMAVVGDPAMRHGIILAKNDIAKKMGVITGESIFSAKKKVGNLVTLTADYPKYVDFAKRTRKIYSEYSDDVIPFGLDEAWIDLSGRALNIGEGAMLADELRARIKAELGLTASVGVSYNYIFSKLASDMKKPDATTVLSEADLQPVIWKKPAFELLFVGPATRRKLTSMGVLTIGDLAQSSAKLLKRALGKNGETLWHFANGDDRGFDPKTPEDDPFKSIGNTVTMPYDLTVELDILTMLYVLSKTISARLKKHTTKTTCIAILIKYSDFTAINRQLTISLPTDKEQQIYESAKSLFRGNSDSKPVRSVGVSVSKLCNNKYEQLTLFSEDENIDEFTEIENNLRGKLKEMKVDKYFNFNFTEGERKQAGFPCRAQEQPL
ncbi:MAG: DNA polymerase IV [Oscillospiraceae bacterium]|nr:DNA polymerase IV [Oscillospiraceae bacterium]